MAELVEPSSMVKRGPGLLRHDHFQVAYVTNDLDRACAVFRERLGLTEFLGNGGTLPSGAEMQVRLARLGGVMYELVEASGPGMEFYNERLPSEFAIRHHHLGYLVHDAETWDALEQEVARGDWRIPFGNNMPEYMNFFYVEAPELGHYLEYIFPGPAGIEFFKQVPEN